MTTDTHKKKTSRFALASLCLSFLVFGVGLTYIGAYQEHWDSLHTNHRAGELMSLCGTAWFFFSIITFFALLSSISRVAWSKGKLRGLGESICAIVIVLFTASMVMPTIGLATHIKCQRVANSFVYESFSKLSNSNVSFSLDKYDDKIDGYSIPQESPRIFEIHYTLKDKLDSWPYPQEFTILLNFDTGEKSIKEGACTEE